MNTKPKAARPGSVVQSSHAIVAIACVALLSTGNAALLAQTEPAAPPAVQPVESPAPEAPKIPNDQLDSLVAPIALYPDPLLAQTLAASTYPLEIIQLQQWMQKNKTLKGKALADAVAKEKWDPSVQSMAGIPDAVQRLAGNIQWTTDLGNAFLAQQQDVMDAVQRMRAKAQGKGALKSSKEQTVEAKTVEGNKEVIVIQQPNPEVVYVPSYDPAVVYGPPAYPYYPYTYPGYVPGMGLAMGTGIILGAAWANNNWGNCDWNNGGNININNNNNFNRNNVNNINRTGNNWQHNPQHRGPAPYSNRSTQNKYGGSDRGGPNTNRPGGDRASTRPAGDRPAANNRPGGDRASTRPAGDRSAANRPSGDRSAANRPSGDRSSANRPGGDRSAASRPSGGNHMANRQVSPSSGGRSSNAFNSGGGFSRSSASASRSRGSHSMGGGSRGGGSRGGGRRR